jgi:hypothetical protein
VTLSSRLLIVAVGLAISGCATTRGPAPGDELAGRTLRMVTPGGQTTLLRFRQDRTVRAEFQGRSLAGRWSVDRRRLCFYWPRAPRECWPYRAPFVRGEARSVTSDRGNVLRVTLI